MLNLQVAQLVAAQRGNELRRVGSVPPAIEIHRDRFLRECPNTLKISCFRRVEYIPELGTCCVRPFSAPPHVVFSKSRPATRRGALTSRVIVGERQGRSVLPAPFIFYSETLCKNAPVHSHHHIKAAQRHPRATAILCTSMFSTEVPNIRRGHINHASISKYSNRTPVRMPRSRANRERLPQFVPTLEKLSRISRTEAPCTIFNFQSSF